MAHFAVLDENNIVTAVNVIADADCLDGETESEAVGIAFCTSLWGSATYKQTSYNNTIRKNFAGVGYKYDSTKDAFIEPQPFPSWILDDETCKYNAPLDHPTVGKDLVMYEWDEDLYQSDNTKGWVEGETIKAPE